MHFRSILVGCVLPFLLWGCLQPTEPTIEPTQNRLESVTPEVFFFTILPDATYSLPFVVRDTTFSFDYSITSPECQFVLRESGTTDVPKQVAVQAVKSQGNGHYTAVFADLGKYTDYRVSVRIGVRIPSSDGSWSIVLSDPITITCGDPSDTPPPDDGTFTGLPVVFINTVNGRGIHSSETWVDAEISIEGGSTFDDMAATPIQIRGRGNTTWYWPKKPYALKFEKRTSVLGMPKHKRWVLLANFMDKTLLRNMVSYEIGRRTSLEWTPNVVYVEVMLNGIHIGNYQMAEQVRVDENRVNITEMTPEDTEGDEVTGGYLFELDFHYDNLWQWHTPKGFPCSVKYPDDDELVSAQFEWAKAYINEVERVLYGSDFADPEIGYAAYLDVQSFADYWLIYELCINHEIGNPGSVFFHKDRLGKLTAGPIWDFDWGTFSYNATSYAEYGICFTWAIWYDRLFQDPAFKALVKRRWEEIRLSVATIPTYIVEQKQLIAASAKLNFQMWDAAEDASQNGGHIINGDERLPFDEAVERMLRIYNQRLSIMDAEIGAW